MSMPEDETRQECQNAWRAYVSSLETVLRKLDADIRGSAGMAGVCTDEWCRSLSVLG